MAVACPFRHERLNSCVWVECFNCYRWTPETPIHCITLASILLPIWSSNYWPFPSSFHLLRRFCLIYLSRWSESTFITRMIASILACISIQLWLWPAFMISSFASYYFYCSSFFSDIFLLSYCFIDELISNSLTYTAYYWLEKESNLNNNIAI